MLTAAVDSRPATRRLIATPRHTAGMLAILAGMTALGMLAQARGGQGESIAPAHPNVIPMYLTLIVLEWALFYYAWVAFRKAGTPLRSVIGGRWNSVRDVLVDLVIAAVFFVIWEGTAELVNRALGPNTAKSINTLLPHGVIAGVLWLALSCSAGFCEELVYRGYLQKQLLAISGSAAVAVAGQAVLFGLSHAYQGTKKVVVITVLGALYGLLAHLRRSLRPGMISHAASDVLALLR